MKQLSGLVGVTNITQSDGTVSLTTSNGALLVAGWQSYNLTTGTGNSGNVDVFSQGTDITASLTGGSLGGDIQARDGSNGVIAAEQSLDQLSYSVGNAVNSQQEAGYDGNGNLATNEPFFSLPANGSTGAAATISVAITDPSQIAASSAAPPATGDNGNALALANIENQTLPGLGGQTAMNYYSNFVAGVGTEVQQATNEQTAQNLVVQQLQNQKASISGVSLDEESANLIQYQTAYSAAARVVNVVNEIAQTALTLGQGS